MRNMTEARVPEKVQHKLLGGNAAEWYGIEPKVFVTDEAGPIERPDWFPQGPELDEWAELVAHPRENREKLKEIGFDMESLAESARGRWWAAAGGRLLMAEVVDVDSHVYEPAAIWDEYVPAARPGPGAAGLLVRPRPGRDGHDHPQRGTGEESQSDQGGPPGHLASGYDHRRDRRHGSRPSPHPINPGAWDPAARVADMDTLGIDRAVVYPTLINEYLPQIADRDAATVLCRAYNDWVWDFSEATGGRLHPVAALPLQDPSAALEELDRTHEKGFRAALFRPAFFWVEDPERRRR